MITPGFLFSATEQYPNFVRLNAASRSSESGHAIEQLGELVARLA